MLELSQKLLNLKYKYYRSLQILSINKDKYF